MIKKILLILVASLSIFNANAQKENAPAIARLVNSTLMYQVLNDFDRNIPLVLFAPGLYFVGSVRSHNNPLFNKSDFYENDELVKTSDYFQKEINDVLSPGLISYIPVDSIMQVRVIDGSVLLFELKFLRKADTMILIQTDAERKKSKSVSYAGDKVIAISYNDIINEISYNNELKGDTLRVSGLVDKPRGINNKTLMRYSGGILTEVSYFNIVSGKTEDKSTDHYYQSELKLPALKYSINRKGKITDSTLYFYDGDKLTHFKSFKGSAEKLSITYSYNRIGQISVKTVRSPIRNYVIDYSFARGNIADLEIDDKIKPFKRHYIFRSDISGKIVGIEYNNISKESLIENLKTQWIFDYNEKKNVSSIKVMDGKGLITKDIRLEYNFFSPGN